MVVLEGNSARRPDERAATESANRAAAGSAGASTKPSQPDEAATRASSTTDARSVFVDERGAVWVATGKGVVVFDDDRTKTAPKFPGAVGVNAITEDQHSRMWFAVESGGALVYDPASGEGQRLSSLDRDHVAAIYSGREGHIWCATDNGAVNADLYSFVDFTTSRGLADNDVLAVSNLLTIKPGSGCDGLGSGPEREVSALHRSLAFAEMSACEPRLLTGPEIRGLQPKQGALRLTGQTLTSSMKAAGWQEQCPVGYKYVGTGQRWCSPFARRERYSGMGSSAASTPSPATTSATYLRIGWADGVLNGSGSC